VPSEPQAEFIRHVAKRYDVTESPRPYSGKTPYRYDKNSTPYSESPAYEVPKYAASVVSPQRTPASASLTDSVRRRKRLERAAETSPAARTPSRDQQNRLNVKQQQMMHQKYQHQIQQQRMQQQNRVRQLQQSPGSAGAAKRTAPGTDKRAIVIQQQRFKLAAPPPPFKTLQQPTYNPLDKRLRALLTQTALGRVENAQSLYQSRQTGLGIPAKVSPRNAVFLELEPYGTLKVNKKLGEGGFASVYLAEEVNNGKKNQALALKVEKPASIWEFYILFKLRGNMGIGPLQTPPLRIHSAHLFKDESVLVMDRFKGTILDAVNKMSGQIGEGIALMWTLDLLISVESMHHNGILHCDIKPDNIMVDNSEGRQAIIIDYGRSLDMSMFHDNVAFVADWDTDNQDCYEMRKRQRWTYQTDFYGVAACIFTMLHGSFIETTFRDGRHQFARGWKRYWQQDIWLPLVDFLLNPNKVCSIPTGEFNWPRDCEKTKKQLEAHRRAIEAYLDANPKVVSDPLRSIREVLK
jgi:checkpoint serine/threonine-protein kinase